MKWVLEKELVKSKHPINPEPHVIVHTAKFPPYKINKVSVIKNGKVSVYKGRKLINLIKYLNCESDTMSIWLKYHK